MEHKLMNMRAINACIYIFIAFMIGVQTDEEGRALFHDFHGLAYVAIICVVLFFWNCIMLILDCWYQYEMQIESRTSVEP